MKRLYGPSLVTLSLLFGCAWSKPGHAVDLGPSVMGQVGARGQTPPQPPPGMAEAYTSAPNVAPASNIVPTQGTVMARVLARVNGQPILYEELLNAAGWRLEEVKPQVPPEQWPQVMEMILRQQLDEIIDREVILSDAKQKVPPAMLEKVMDQAGKDFDKQLRKQRDQLKLKSDEEMRIYLEKQGRNVAEMRRQYERSNLAMEYMRSRIRDKTDQIDREQMVEYYRAHIKEYEHQEQVEWQHIFIAKVRYPNPAAARQQAEQVHRLVQGIRTKEEFVPISQAYSHSYNRDTGMGEGKLRQEIRPPEVAQTVWQLAPGQVAPLIENSEGYHIVRVIDHRQAGRTPFSDVQMKIKAKIQQEMGQEEIKKMLKEMRASAFIETGVGSSYSK
jgi:parvulin-like peptidyl-prolyl isomerase